MNSTKQINSNFADLLGLDLAELRKKIEKDILQQYGSDTSDSGNTQSSVSRNGQSSVSRNGQSSVSGNSKS